MAAAIGCGRLEITESAYWGLWWVYSNGVSMQGALLSMLHTPHSGRKNGLCSKSRGLTL